MRVLNISRCELKDVNGMQAFAQLEELYIGYNELDELFDIGFLEHLQVLDFESNKIKDLDQLFYLRRNKKLTHLNLRYNPVAYGHSIGSSHGPNASKDIKIVEYFERIRDCCPNIEELDDQEVDRDYFSEKIRKVHSVDTFENGRTGIRHLDFFRRFEQMTK